MTELSEALFIGGRSGVGKTTVAYELHSQLSAQDLRHCLIEGDNLDMAHPAPWVHGLAEKNLAAMWKNYRELGYRRLIYTNTVSVRQTQALATAMGDDPGITGVLLMAEDLTTYNRLAGRESGLELDSHYGRSQSAARELDLLTPPWVHRIKTDGRPPADIAREILLLTGWQH
ncbi:adenylyl-sulfate kinase [Arthrobacter sp. ISL-48]|uniref:adenylyl-sulfate kinase n=1 Tax=Arthrobacter sp. ISL-48 TaxID=2819110 RepID=UPI001BE708D4|nr:adenylyl-sulfate kinase [Arthrobacter sp. ISL-48]MBT2531505.1 adenylyl-sulfate kinase [Arthrobacter sp. ISL-48]